MPSSLSVWSLPREIVEGDRSQYLLQGGVKENVKIKTAKQIMQEAEQNYVDILFVLRD